MEMPGEEIKKKEQNTKPSSEGEKARGKRREKVLKMPHFLMEAWPKPPDTEMQELKLKNRICWVKMDCAKAQTKPSSCSTQTPAWQPEMLQHFSRTATSTRDPGQFYPWGKCSHSPFRGKAPSLPAPRRPSLPIPSPHTRYDIFSTSAAPLLH